MKKSLLALFAAAALSSGMANATATAEQEDFTPPEVEEGTSEATFQWSGLVPEREIVNSDGLFIKPAKGSRDFLDGTLVFSNDNNEGDDKIRLVSSTTLSFEVHSVADADSPLDTYDWQLQYMRVGINEADPFEYFGEFFDVALDGEAIERRVTNIVADGNVPQNLSIISKEDPSSTVPDIANDLKALDTVVIQAAIVVKATGDFGV